MGVTITLSREMGSRGEEIAAEVAAAMHLRVVGSEIIHQALEAGIPSDVAVESEEGRRGFIGRALDALHREPITPARATLTLWGDQPLDAYMSESVGRLGDDYYLALLESMVFDLAETEDLLLIGRAGQMMLRGKPDTLHVRIHAPLESRVGVIAERFQLSPDEAQRKVEANDAGRADYLHRHYKVDINNTRLYDLTLNTGTLSRDAAVKLIVDAAKDKFGRTKE
jgi:hypothetical protein